MLDRLLVAPGRHILEPAAGADHSIVLLALGWPVAFEQIVRTRTRWSDAGRTIPQPDELVFVSSFAGGEVFRSGCCFHRGNGRIFYLSPGDEHYPVYRHPDIRRVLANAVGWAHNPQPAMVPTTTHSPNSPDGWFRDSQPEVAR